MSEDMMDVVREFLEESRENLDQVDIDLIALEKTPDAKDLIARIFRAMHTVKGTCGFLGFGRLEAVAHAGENVLSALRDQRVRLTPAMASVLLRTVDAIRGMLDCIEQTENDGDGDYAALIDDLHHLQDAPDAHDDAEATDAHDGGEMFDHDEAPAPVVAAAPVAPVAAVPVVSAVALPVAAAPVVAAVAVPVVAAVAVPVAAPVVASPPASLAPALPVPVPTHDAPMPRSSLQAATQDLVAPAAPAAVDSSIRVDVGLLDKLMNLVGELVLARNQIIQFKATGGDATFVGAQQRLNLITSELQEGVMKTRMQPIGNIWGKFPRVVRDLAVSCGKQVRLEMEGEQTELDKTLIEAIKDPLTHLVRNAVDHGIESPADRVARQKPAEGCLRLCAFHEGGQVNIEVSDDGAGIDSDRIRQKAIERGMISPEQAARMSEREILRLIFLPGFSTAAKVTNVSGRGVGMDVVLTNIERIGGTIELSSQRGRGSTMKIKIPLTLAIIRGVIVTSGDNRYVIPQASVFKLIRLEGAQARAEVEYLHEAPVYRLRGKLLPLVYLAEALEEPPTDTDVVNIVVLNADGRQFGLVVRTVQDTEEIVVKAIGKHLKSASVFAGATIMGDGQVALILDIMGLAKRARVMSESHERTRLDAVVPIAAAVDDRQGLLVFRTPGNGRMAIPLARVARLEELPRSQLEWAGNERLIQYRGSIITVLELSSLLEERRSAERLAEAEAGLPPLPADTIQLVVFSHEGVQIGLIVEHVVDIVEESLGQSRPAGRAGVLGTVVIQGRVTELLDVEAILRSAHAMGALRGLAAPTRQEALDHGA